MKTRTWLLVCENLNIRLYLRDWNPNIGFITTHMHIHTHTQGYTLTTLKKVACCGIKLCALNTYIDNLTEEIYFFSEIVTASKI